MYKYKKKYQIMKNVDTMIVDYMFLQDYLKTGTLFIHQLKKMMDGSLNSHSELPWYSASLVSMVLFHDCFG